MASEFTTSYLQDASERLHFYKLQAERAIEQVTDELFFTSLDPGSNSVAVIVQHLSGNMRSRWTDFLTTDGEKVSRNYKAEFENPHVTRANLMHLWESAWSCAFETLDSLTEEHLAQTIYIRGEAHSVTQAVNRQIAHTAYHVGQIVYLAKHFAATKWKPLKTYQDNIPSSLGGR